MCAAWPSPTASPRGCAPNPRGRYLGTPTPHSAPASRTCARLGRHTDGFTSGLRPEPPRPLPGGRGPTPCAAPRTAHIVARLPLLRGDNSTTPTSPRHPSFCPGGGKHVRHPGVNWQARRESNPQPPVLETGALPIELLACAGRPLPLHLLRLPMHRVRATPPAVFPELQPAGRLPLVLGRAVVAPFAVGARQRNDGPHGPLYFGASPQTPATATRGPHRPTPQSRAAHVRGWAGYPGLPLVFAPNPRSCYSTMSVTAPDPTVRPPSRMANRNPFSRATGVISSTTISTLSPGITISTPSGNVATPVTSVVRR